MVCPNCSRENNEQSAFCIGCGRSLQHTCRACGAKNPLDAEYCSACGMALAEETAGAAEQQHEPQALSCPRCHSLNEPGSRFCGDCGFPLDELASEASARHDYLPAWELGRPAGFWIRVVAAVIDGALLLLAAALLAGVFFGQNYFKALGDETVIWSTGDTINALLGAVYTIGMVAAFSGTLGKLLLGMRIVRTDGSPVSLATAILRYFAGIVSGLLLGIGYLMVAFRRDKRGLHDLLCDTAVVIVKD